MIVYNVTIQVDKSIAEEWLPWLMHEHIPEVIGTGCFESARVLQMIETDDSEGPTYTVQYEALSKAIYNEYIAKYADEMRRRSFDKWGNKFIAFRSLMAVVN